MVLILKGQNKKCLNQITHHLCIKVNTQAHLDMVLGRGDRHAALVKMLIAIRKRGESEDYAREEALKFANACNPPENHNEVLFQVKDIWSRYAP